MSYVLELKHIELKPAGASRSILSGINYQIAAGDFIIVLGSNGSGKSSLLKLIDRRYQPSSGKIVLDDRPIASYATRIFCQRVKTLTQNTHESLFNSLTVYENYLLIEQGPRRNRAFLQDYLRQFNSNLPNKLDQVVDGLSGGEKQVLALALIVLHPPQILLLDEHTSALDPKTADNVMAITNDIIRQYQITCLLATHDLAIAEQYGNRVLAMKNGCMHHCIDHHDKVLATQTVLLASCY